MNTAAAVSAGHRGGRADDVDRSSDDEHRDGHQSRTRAHRLVGLSAHHACFLARYLTPTTKVWRQLED